MSAAAAFALSLADAGIEISPAHKTTAVLIAFT
jgi:hypothetical protein